MTPLASARKALRLALIKDCGESHSDTLAVVYMRLLVAHRAGHGVRLSPDEVYALLTMDDAVVQAVHNVEAELVGKDARHV